MAHCTRVAFKFGLFGEVREIDFLIFESESVIPFPVMAPNIKQLRQAVSGLAGLDL